MKTKPYQLGADNVGIIAGEPNGSYHANPAISNSDLKDFARSPAYFKAKRDGLIERKETAALAFGSACHALILEGNEAYLNQIAVVPQDAPDKRTKAGKEWWEKFDARAGGKELVKWDDDQRMRAMREAVKANSLACRVLYENRVHTELTFRTGVLPQFGFAVQCRADLFGIDEQGAYIADVKTIDSLSADLGEFKWQLGDYGYYRQCAFYRLVANSLLGDKEKVRRFVFVVVEKQPPHQVAVCVVDDDSVDLGGREVLRDLYRLSECYKSGNWRGIDPVEHVIGLPAWKRKQVEESLIVEATA